MLRIIVREADGGDACNVGGPVHITLRTFDVDLPEVERFLREPATDRYLQYKAREIIGVELVGAVEQSQKTEG